MTSLRSRSRSAGSHALWKPTEERCPRKRQVERSPGARRTSRNVDARGLKDWQQAKKVKGAHHSRLLMAQAICGCLAARK